MNEINKAVSKGQQKGNKWGLIFVGKMVWFTFTFLLGIPNNNEEKLKDDIKEKDGKSQVGKNYCEIEVSKPEFLCHIEYVLIPNEAAKFIDVVCWNRAVKIYYENSTSAIIPFEVKKLKWIHFRVNHNVKLKREDIPLFREHNIKFTVSLGSKKLGEPAKSDKPKKFYGPKFADDTSIRKQIFQPLSETLQDLVSISYFKEHLTPQQQLYISLDTTLETSENYEKLFKTLIELSNEYHDEKAIKTPSPPFQEIPPLVNTLKATETYQTPNLKSGTAKKLDKKTDIKNKEFDKMEFSITGEQFLSGRKVFENCLKYNSELPFLFSIGTVKNLLSKVQNKLYSPLSVVISRLNYLPVEQLKKKGVTQIKFRFFICNHLLAESNLIPIDKEMKINYARTIFTNTIDKAELIYFIRTGGLNIDILGHVGKSQDRLDDGQGKGKQLEKPDKEFITLGRVSADISSILLQPHRALMKCDFQMSNDKGASYECQDNNNQYTSINEFNCCCKKRGNENGSNSHGILGPVMTIRAGLGHPLFNAWQTVTMNPDLFNRLFAVFYSVDLAIPIIQMIQDEADEVLGLTDYIKNGKNVKRPLTKNHAGRVTNGGSSRKTLMTGFLIDCVDKILLFAESSVFGGIQKVWASVSLMNPIHGHILYDSSLIFLDRLYGNFFQFGGFIGINLKEPPQVTLSKPQSYGSQIVPRPAWKALTCLNLLTHCKSIRTATRNNLFPDFKSLVSLTIEFGAPIQIYEKRQ